MTVTTTLLIVLTCSWTCYYGPKLGAWIGGRLGRLLCGE